MRPDTCGPKAALQMIMRSRNLTTGNIYVCVDMEGPIRETIPKKVGSSFGAIKQYLLHCHTVIRGTLNPDASINSKHKEKHPELYELPMDMIEHNAMRKTINPDDPYFNGYCAYIQDRVKQERHYLFLLFLYLRDQGVGYGGELSEFTPDQIEDVRVDNRNFTKNTNEKDVDNHVRAPDITDEICHSYRKAGKQRVTLTDEQVYSMKKHGLKNLLGTKNITHWDVKARKGKKNKFNKLKQYKECIGVTDETERSRLIAECADITIAEINEDDNSIVIMAEDKRILTRRHCEHALEIIQIATPGVKLENMGYRTQIAITEDDLDAKLKEYFTQNIRELEVIMGSRMKYKEELQEELPDDTIYPYTEDYMSDVNMLRNRLTLVARQSVSTVTQIQITPDMIEPTRLPEHVRALRTDNIGTTNIINSTHTHCVYDKVDLIRSASELINSCFGMTFKIDKKNRCLINGISSRNIYISSPWEVRQGKLLPWKGNTTTNGEDLVLQDLLPGSTTSAEWIKQKISNLNRTTLSTTLTTLRTSAMPNLIPPPTSINWWEMPYKSATNNVTITNIDNRRKNIPNNYNPMTDGPLVQLKLF